MSETIEYRIVWSRCGTRWNIHKLNKYPYTERIYTTETQVKNALVQLERPGLIHRVETRTVSEWS